MTRLPIETRWKYSDEIPVLRYSPTPGWHTLRIISAKFQTVLNKDGKTSEMFIINWKDLTPTNVLDGVIPKFSTVNYMNGMMKNVLIKIGMIVSGGKLVGIPHPDTLTGVIIRAYTMNSEKYNSEHGAVIRTYITDVEDPTSISVRCRYCGRRMNVIEKGPIHKVGETRLEENDITLECTECGIYAYGYSQYELRRTIIEDWDVKEDDGYDNETEVYRV